MNCWWIIIMMWNDLLKQIYRTLLQPLHMKHCVWNSCLLFQPSDWIFHRKSALTYSHFSLQLLIDTHTMSDSCVVDVLLLWNTTVWTSGQSPGPRLHRSTWQDESHCVSRCGLCASKLPSQVAVRVKNNQFLLYAFKRELGDLNFKLWTHHMNAF